MSTYTDYDVISKNYDEGRRPAAADVIAELIQTKTGKSVQDIRLLDVGCGTGNYATEMVKFGVRNITLFDASEGMLSKAKAKFEEIQNRLPLSVEFKQGLLPNLPFEDQTYDALMMNMVIHHLEPSPDGKNFPTINKTFQNVHRVLKPGGVVIITTSTPEQTKGIWFYNLVPYASARYQIRQPTLQMLEDMFLKNGLECQKTMAYLRSDWLQDYDNIEAPLRPEWRALESFWSSTTDDEIVSAIKLIKQLKATNKLEEFYRKYNKCSTIGSFTLLCATRANKAQ